MLISRRQKALLALWAWAAMLWLAPGVWAAEKLSKYTVDAAQTSVSGLSSGGYMAGQFHVAFSGTLIGAGIVAGGPYNCAQGLLATALNQCMDTLLGAPDPARLFAVAQGLAGQGRIDDLANLADDKVYVFSGTRDETVDQSVVAETVAFYRLAGVAEANILYVDDVDAGHAFITQDFGATCATTATPFINDCDLDQAGAILGHIYGTLIPPAASPGGRIIEFDQSEFIADPSAHSMNDVGYAYVPAACSGGQTCRVHVVFHGCRQTTADIGDKFYRQTGYNGWADTNRLIILYPQAVASLANPRGCWDWWGYDSAAYPVRAGPQMAAVKRMLDRIAGVAPDGGFCAAHSGSNYGHWLDGRAELCNFWFVCAKGSGENLGFAFSSVTLYEQPQGTFSTTACTP